MQHFLLTKPVMIVWECVRGFGVCCLFTAECGQRTTERAVYFQPAPATPTPAPCTLAITPLDRDVRQVPRSDSTFYSYQKYFISTKNIFDVSKKYYFISIKNIFYINQYPFTLPRSELSLRLSYWQIPTKMVFVIKNILRYVSFTHLSIIST